MCEVWILQIGKIKSKEQNNFSQIRRLFHAEKIIKQYTVLSYRIDLYSVKFGIKIQQDKVEAKIKNIFGCNLIRFNLDEKKCLYI